MLGAFEGFNVGEKQNEESLRVASALPDWRVLDLSLDIAGPYCAGLMAGLGAEVLKIEPLDGDPARRVGPFFQDDPHPEKSGLFLYANQGKKSITLNLQTETGRKIFLRLLPSADVVVESYPPGYLSSMGLGYSALETINPRLVLTSVSHFGQDGPYRDWQGSELVDYALSGLLHQLGDPDREPLKTGGSVAQYYAGQMAYMATLTAVLSRWITGEGQHIDLSVTEALASMVEHATADWQYAGVMGTGRTAPNQGRAAGQGQYLCKDGFVQIAPGPGETGLGRLADLMGIPELADPRFATVEGRTEHKEEIDQLMQPWLGTHTKLEIYQMGQERHLTFGYPCTAEDLLKSPQFQDRGYFVDVAHPATGAITYPGAPFKMSETPWQARRAPLLGEHNDEVYCGLLGYSKRELTMLRDAGVV